MEEAKPSLLNDMQALIKHIEEKMVDSLPADDPLRHELATIKTGLKACEARRVKRATKSKTAMKKHPRLGFGRPQRLSPEMAAFMGLEVPIASIKICAYFIATYRFLSAKICGIAEPSRLTTFFKAHPAILQAKCEIVLGAELQQAGFITKEVVRDKWDDAKFSQLEDLLDNCRAAKQNKDQDLNGLAKRWLELGLTPFDAPSAE